MQPVPREGCCKLLSHLESGRFPEASVAGKMYSWFTCEQWHAVCPLGRSALCEIPPTVSTTSQGCPSWDLSVV